MIYNLIIYTTIITIISFIFLRIYLKIKHPFWYEQPVFHYYNLLYWLNPPGIINNSLPNYNKYTNLYNIISKKYTNINNTEKQLIINLLNDNFLKDNIITYYPNNKHIFNYLKHNSQPSYIAIYKKPRLLIDSSYSSIINDEIYIGILTSRVLYIKFKKHIIPVNYVDNLCVHKDFRQKNIAKQLIQTHYYNTRNFNKQICVSLFKREGIVNKIVPLVAYQMIAFDISPIINLNLTIINGIYKYVRITKQTYYLIHNILYNNKNLFDCIIMPDISNLLYLINNENIFIYALLHNGIILSIYFYRNMYMKYKQNNCIELFCSIYDKSLANNDFVYGFIYSLYNINKIFNFNYIFIENLSNNNIIIDYLKKKKYNIIAKNTNAYFLYNYAILSFEPSKCIIIN